MFEKFKNVNTIPSQCFCAPEFFIEKGWGREDFIFHTDYENKKHLHDIGVVETVKLLHFDKDKKLSLHFHLNKHEFFRMVIGAVLVELIDLQTQTIHTFTLEEDQKLFIPAGLIHRMTGLNNKNVMLEVSSIDKPEDSFRLQRGD